MHVSYIYILKYRHAPGQFEGHYNIRAYKTRQEAEKGMQEENAKHPEYGYSIEVLKLAD